MERVQFITHKEKEILFIDFSGLDTKEFPKILEEGRKLAEERTQHSFLILVDTSNTHHHPAAIEAGREFAARFGSDVKKAAVIGATKFQKNLISIIAIVAKIGEVSFFNNREEAKDWLVEEKKEDKVSLLEGGQRWNE